MVNLLTKFSKSTWAISVTAIALTLFLVACDRQVHTVFGPSVDNSSNELIAAISDQPAFEDVANDNVSNEPQLAGLLTNLTKSIISHSLDSARITVKSGGQLIIRNESGNGQVVVPPYAVTRDVTISAETWKIRLAGLEYCEFRFGPDGLKFSPNATMTLPGSLFTDSRGLIPTEILWLYLNPLSGKWELLNTIRQAKDGNFYVPVYHFSTYRAANKNQGLSQGGQ